MKRLRRLLFLGGWLFALGLGAVWLLWSRCGLEGCPDVNRLRGYVPDEASVLLDRNGEEIGQLFLVNRLVVPLDSLPPYLPDAFIAVEDQRFWSHRGVDWYRVLGAAWANLRARRVEEGSSTITMQLARNVFPERIPQSQRTIGRKLTEMRVAGKIEKHFTKEQIIELYLNQIYFGDGAYGIEAAAAEYFGKPAAELTLGEATILAGLIPAPHRLSPRRNLEGSLRRRDVVLGKMVEQGMTTREEAEKARAESIVLGRSRRREGGRAPYFVEGVRQELEEELGAALYTSGYIIHTTLDPRVQRVAEEELEAQLRAVEAGRHGSFRQPRRGSEEGVDTTGAEVTRYLQGAVVVIDAASGDILALVGGRDFGDSRFDRATQAWRQPGSAFKPFVYGAALAQGFSPAMVLSDEPLRITLPDGRVWEPRNFEGSYRGNVTMRQALAQSRNVPTIRLAEEVGIHEVIDFARRAGLSGTIPPVPSIAIGAAEVTLLELTTAFAAFATLGRRPTPRLVTRVEDRRGRVVWERPVEARRVIDPAVAFLLTDLLRGVIDHGTGTGVRAAGFRGPAAGKTGTTNDATDVWFLGYTPEWAAGVWIGFDQPRTILRGATGGRLAAPVWGRIMRRTHPPGGAGWTPPPGVEQRWVDAAGNLYEEGCPTFGDLRAEYFIAGTRAPDGCSMVGPPLLGRPLGPDSGWVDPSMHHDSAGAAEERWWEELRRRLPPAPELDSGISPPTEPSADPGQAAPTPGRPPGTGEPPRDSVDHSTPAVDDPPRSRPAPRPADPDGPPLLGEPLPGGAQGGATPSAPAPPR